MAETKLMKVIIRTTEDIVFNGDSDRISSYNEVGRFDIYPMHANFISILHKEIVLYMKNREVKKIPIEQAILKVKDDLVHIFLGIEALLIEDEPGNKTRNV